MFMRGLGHSLALLAMITAGCSLGPRRFRDVNDPSPLVRARAAGLADQLPRETFVPELIGHLDDPDAVVRLSAHEELRRRTGQDFGYRPWDDKAEREAATACWRQWWESQTRPTTAAGEDSSPGPRIVPPPAEAATGGPSL